MEGGNLSHSLSSDFLHTCHPVPGWFFKCVDLCIHKQIELSTEYCSKTLSQASFPNYLLSKTRENVIFLLHVI